MFPKDSKRRAVQSFRGQKRPKSAFFHVFGMKLGRGKAPGPGILQAILFSDMLTDFNQLSTQFDQMGGTGRIPRDAVYCELNN